MERATTAYLNHLEARHFSDSHLKHVQRTLAMLAVYLNEAFQITDWRGVGERHLRAFGVHLAIHYRSPKRSNNSGRRVSVSTHQYWLRICCKFFRWMKESNYLLHDPSQLLQLPSRPDVLPRVISENAMARLIEMANTDEPIGIRDRAIMETLYATGIRHAEAHNLMLYDVDTVGGRLTIRQGKGRKDRIVPLTSTATQWLIRYITVARPELAAGKRKKFRKGAQHPLPPTPALWLAATGQRLCYQMIAARIAKYADEAEIKRVCVHTFRHACATHLLRGGASIRHVQRLLGHKSIDTTEIYTHVEIDDLRKVVEVASSDSSASDKSDGEMQSAILKSAKPEITWLCPKCGSKYVTRHGHCEHGRQRYFCHQCHSQTVEDRQSNAYSEERREEVWRAYKERGNMSEVARTFGIPYQTIYKWIIRRRAQPPPPNGNS